MVLLHLFSGINRIHPVISLRLQVQKELCLQVCYCDILSFNLTSVSSGYLLRILRICNMLNLSALFASADVGPTLGIAKSSSLESLQTAVESSIAQNKLDNSFPIPRPLPKVDNYLTELGCHYF